MIRKILRNIAGFAYGGYLEMNSIPSTQRRNLETFSNYGSLREWQQLNMYMRVMEETADIPGDIAEFGVASGTSLRAFARINGVLNVQRPHEYAKKTVYGFDSFEGLPELDVDIDLASAEARITPDMKKGGFDSRGTLADLEDFATKRGDVKLVKGFFSDTLPVFIKENPHVSFSLIHIDCDIYSSSKEVMDLVFPRLNIGGIVLFDEIFHPVFPGETAAFWEVYNSIGATVPNFKLHFFRSTSMPWKWYARRES